MDTYAFAEASSKVKWRSYKVTKKSTVVPTVGFFGTVNRTPGELKGADGLKQEYFVRYLWDKEYWILTHLLRHPAKSKGDVMRSPRSPRFSPLLVSLAQSTEHPGNSRGLMG